MKFTTASVTLRYCHNGGISDAVPERPTRRCSGRAQRDEISAIRIIEASVSGDGEVEVAI
jgi:hypothetical protein